MNWHKIRQYMLPLLRYALSGGAAVIMEYASFLLLFYGFGWPLIVSNSISFIIGIITSFLLNRQWTFRGSSGKMHHQFMMYGLLAMINFCLTNLLVWHLAVWNIPPFIAKPAVMGLTAGWNFLIFKKVIFKSTLERH